MNSFHICSSLDSVSQSLTIRHATTKFEIAQLREALNAEHYLKAGRPSGNTIWQGVYKNDLDEDYPILCGVLCWSGAVMRLKDRDDWIDWDPLTRSSRLPLITSLRRFIILETQREPNLATRCMGLALRRLPGHFEEKYGYAGMKMAAPLPWQATAEKRTIANFPYHRNFSRKAVKFLKMRPLHRMHYIPKKNELFNP